MADTHGPILNVTRARQGLQRGTHTVTVLLVSTVLVVLVLAAAWVWRSGQFTAVQANQTPTAQDVAQAHQSARTPMQPQPAATP
jgi:cytoskeletal protein RodZ